MGIRRLRYPGNFLKACHALWCVHNVKLNYTQTGHLVGLHAGTVCHIVHGRRFPGAFPVPLPGF
jgi:hypothetical protein